MNKWNEKETLNIITLLEDNKSYKEISILLNRSLSSIRNKLIREKLYTHRNKISDVVDIYCLNCNKKINTTDKKRKFCNHSCSATYNNKKKIKKEPKKKLIIYFV